MMRGRWVLLVVISSRVRGASGVISQRGIDFEFLRSGLHSLVISER